MDQYLFGTQVNNIICSTLSNSLMYMLYHHVFPVPDVYSKLRLDLLDWTFSSKGNILDVICRIFGSSLGSPPEAVTVLNLVRVMDPLIDTHFIPFIFWHLHLKLTTPHEENLPIRLITLPHIGLN